MRKFWHHKFLYFYPWKMYPRNLLIIMNIIINYLLNYYILPMNNILELGFDIEFFGVPHSQIPFVQDEIFEST